MALYEYLLDVEGYGLKTFYTEKKTSFFRTSYVVYTEKGMETIKRVGIIKKDSLEEVKKFVEERYGKVKN